MATYTPEEFKKVMDRFTKGLPKAMARASLEAAQKLNADISGRIFRVGGTQDTKGGTRTYKSDYWKDKRSDKGLQTSKVDHVFNEDLQRSIKLVEERKQVSVKIIGKKNVDKARGADEQYKDVNGAPVFFASDKETKIALEVFNESIVKYIEEIFS